MYQSLKNIILGVLACLLLILWSFLWIYLSASLIPDNALATTLFFVSFIIGIFIIAAFFQARSNNIGILDVPNFWLKNIFSNSLVKGLLVASTLAVWTTLLFNIIKYIPDDHFATAVFLIGFAFGALALQAFFQARSENVPIRKIPSVWKHIISRRISVIFQAVFGVTGFLLKWILIVGLIIGAIALSVAIIVGLGPLWIIAILLFLILCSRETI